MTDNPLPKFEELALLVYTWENQSGIKLFFTNRKLAQIAFDEQKIQEVIPINAEFDKYVSTENALTLLRQQREEILKLKAQLRA